jgi:hypothetical protein
VLLARPLEQVPSAFRLTASYFSWHELRLIRVGFGCLHYAFIITTSSDDQKSMRRGLAEVTPRMVSRNKSGSGHSAKEFFVTAASSVLQYAPSKRAL